MDESLLQAIQKELNINPYTGENEIQYAVRLLYSACASWMRYFVLDEDEYGNAYPKTKKYLLNRSKETISRLLEAFPECQNWFIDETDTSPFMGFIQTLRERMLESGELLSNDEAKIVLPKASAVSINGEGDWVRVLGFDDQEKNKNIISTGIARIRPGDSECKKELECPFNSEEFVQKILGIKKWSICGKLDDFEFFDPTTKRPLYQAWIQPDKTEGKLSLGRLAIINGKYEYYMFKKVGRAWENIKLPTFFQDKREQQRIMLGLRSKVGNPMRADFKKAGQCIILYLYCRLPLIEETRLKTYCWPLNSYNDEICYVVPWQLWPKIHQMCENLCIKPEEKPL